MYSNWNTPMNEIEPGLFLGSIDAAEDKSLLIQHNIKNIICAMDFGSPNFPNDFNYLHIRIADHFQAPIADWFETAVRFIHQSLNSGDNVLVHCFAGVSRSSTLVIAYLMAKYGIQYEAAYKLVQSKRDIVFPNEGFQRQLRSTGPERLGAYLK